MNLSKLCDEIEAGYANELSAYDDEMMPLVVELSEKADTIRDIIVERNAFRGALVWLVEQARLSDLPENNASMRAAQALLHRTEERRL